jgi:hypothetical protein
LAGSFAIKSFQDYSGIGTSAEGEFDSRHLHHRKDMMKAPVHPKYCKQQRGYRGVDEVLYAGVDAHRTATHITIVNDTGKVLTRKRVSSSSDGLRTIFANYNEPIKAVVEATYNWGPVYDWLDEIVDEVILAHPTNQSQSPRDQHDRLDSD